MTSTVFFILAIGFIISGRWLRNEIKLFNEDLERQMRGKFIYATLVLSVPSIIRAIYNIFSAVFNLDNNVIGKSIEDNTWVAPIIYFFFITVADLFPITSQLVSMFVVNDSVDDANRQSFGLKSDDTTEENLSIIEVDRFSYPSKIKPLGEKNSSPHLARKLSSSLLPELILKK